MNDFLTAPIDAASAATLSQRGLHFALVDTSNPTEFEAWLRADFRGFHGAEPTAETIAENLAGVADRRTTGVWDGSALDASSPVATVSSWPVEMTSPGRRSLQAWAISSVTVSPTHRRKGIARAMLEAELRTAHELGVPMATLTVSESTIYGRFGFAAAAFATNITIDTRRAKWIGPEASGRINFISPTQFRAEVEAMHDRVRLDSPGHIPAWGKRWDEISGLVSASKDNGASLRAVRYDDIDGQVRGLALYKVSGAGGDSEGDFAKHTLTLEYLSHETDEAYAALWRFLLEIDLIDTIKAMHRSVDEPLLWNLSDRRGVSESTWDHLWLRILDVTETLESRTYSAPGHFVLRVEDDLGYADGAYVLDVDDAGVGTVTPAADDATDVIALPVSSLSALYLGGVSATTLASAGLISGSAAAVAALDASFHSSRAPWLSIWF